MFNNAAIAMRPYATILLGEESGDHRPLLAVLLYGRASLELLAELDLLCDVF